MLLLERAVVTPLAVPQRESTQFGHTGDQRESTSSLSPLVVPPVARRGKMIQVNDAGQTTC
jgi:hypothetical protein